MLLLKFCIGPMALKQTCGASVWLHIFFYVEADLSGHEQNQAYFEQSWRQSLVSKKNLGLLCLLRLETSSSNYWIRIIGGDWRLHRPWVSCFIYQCRLVARSQMLKPDFYFSCSGHPWLRGCQEVKIPLDISIYRLVRTYICSSSLRKSALRVHFYEFHMLFLCLLGIVANTSVHGAGPCQDLNSGSTLLSTRTIFITRPKQEWICCYPKLQDG